MRALCALMVLHLNNEGQEHLIKALDALFNAFWVDHKKTNEKDILTEVLQKVLGEDKAKKGTDLVVLKIDRIKLSMLTGHLTVLDMAGKEGKEALAKNTDQAFADGAFGLPWLYETQIWLASAFVDTDFTLVC